MPRSKEKLQLSPGTRAFETLSAEKQECIYSAAVDEFATHGYSSASMNSLVRKAGISKGSLFQYFRSKPELFDGIVRVAFNRVKSTLRNVRAESEGRDLPERLEMLLRSGFRFIREHPRLARIYFHLLHSGDAPFGTERLRYLSRRSQEFLVEMLAEARDSGELAENLDLERSAFLLNTMFEGLLRAFYLEHLDPESRLFQADRSEQERWVRCFLTLVSRGLCTPEAVHKRGAVPHGK